MQGVVNAVGGIALVVVPDDGIDQLVGTALAQRRNDRHALTDALQKVLVARGAQDVREAVLQRIPARRKSHRRRRHGLTAPGLGFLGIDKHAARQQRFQHVVAGDHVPLAEQQIALRVTHAQAAARHCAIGLACRSAESVSSGRLTQSPELAAEARSMTRSFRN